MDGLLGRKIGMTQVYDAAGHRVGVTVLEVGPCTVVQRKTKATDGYEAVQLGFVEQKPGRLPKAQRVRFEKAAVKPTRFLREFGVGADEAIKAGDAVTVAALDGVAFVDIVGMTKGKGFAGVVKRHHMRGGRMTHGGHSKRRVGSIGMKTWPARVAKGKRMPGHLGASVITTQNLRVVEIHAAENLVLVEGAVPGPTGSVVEIRRALKKAGKTT